MFSPNSFIDAFQATKKALTNQVITDPELNKVAHNFIEAQTTFAKMLVKNTTDVSKYLVDAHTSFWFPKEQK